MSVICNTHNLIWDMAKPVLNCVEGGTPAAVSRLMLHCFRHVSKPMFLSSDSLTHDQIWKLRLGYGVVNALGIYLRLVQINQVLQYSSMDT